MNKKRFVCIALVLVVCFGCIFIKVSQKKVRVKQTESQISISVSSKEYKEKMKDLFSSSSYIVWSEFNELPVEETYDSVVEYEGQAYGVNTYSSDSNLLTVVYYYDGVYLSRHYLKFNYHNGTLTLEYVDNTNRFTDTELQVVLVDYLKANGIG